MILIIFFITITFQSADSLQQLYSKNDYSKFIELSKEFIQKNAGSVTQYELILKLAVAYQQLGKFDFAKRAYHLALSKDSLLNDYIGYQLVLINMQESQWKRIDWSGIVSLRNARLQRTLYFQTIDSLIRYEHYDLMLSLYAKRSFFKEDLNTVQKSVLSYALATNQLMQFLADAIQYINKNPTDIFANNLCAELMRDSLIQHLNPAEQLALVKHIYSNNSETLYSKADSIYQIHGDLDIFKHIQIKQLLHAKNYQSALDLLLEYRNKSIKIVEYYRQIPRLYARLNQESQSYEAYLNFARTFPKNAFSKKAVDYVLNRTEKSNSDYFLLVLNEFSNKDWQFKQHFTFRKFIFYYENNQINKALNYCDEMIKEPKLTLAFQEQLKYWKAKILIERNDRKAGFEILVEIAKNPFTSYYANKAYVALIQNEIIPKENAVLELPKRMVLDTELSRRLRSIHDVFGRNEFIREFSSINKQKIETAEEFYALKGVAEDLGLYHHVIRLAFLFNFKSAQLNVEQNNISHFAFPQYYLSEVNEAASKFLVEKELILAIIHRESSFQNDAVSQANAHGLMQLIPETANRMAKKHKISMSDFADIYNPQVNIPLGAAYLSELLKRYDQKLEFVLSAYNAGPSRADRWRKEAHSDNIDLFIEKIAFDETRNYVKKVLHSYYSYKILMKNFDHIYYSGIRYKTLP